MTVAEPAASAPAQPAPDPAPVKADEEIKPMPVAVVQQQPPTMAQAEPQKSNDLDINAGPNDLDGPGGFHSETGVVVTDSQFTEYVADFEEVRRHVRINPMTGRAEGDPYYLHKYEEDRRAIAMHDHGREEHSLTPENHGESSTFQQHDPFAEQRHDSAHGSEPEHRSGAGLPPAPVPQTHVTPPPPAPLPSRPLHP